MRRRKIKGDYAFYSLSKTYKQRKIPIAWCTKATGDFLVLLHKMHPDEDILSLWVRLCDRTQFIYNPEAIEVLEKHIEYGEGNLVPLWK